MGKKRQRGGAHGGENAKLPSQSPSQNGGTAAEPSTKKHKKAPLQLKMIVMKGATTAKPLKQQQQSEASGAVSSPQKPQDTEPSKKKKKKSKNKANAATASAAPATTEKTTKQNTADIDDLFQSLKAKKQENAQAAEREAAEAKRAKKQARQERERLDEQIKELEAQNTNLTAVQGKNPDARPLRYDEDGLPIYSEESLQINQGGDTADCPFDCWCCF